MAGQSLKIIANSGQIINLVHEKQMSRLTAVFFNEEIEVKTRVSIGEAFIIIAKNKGLRKIFFQRELLNMLFSLALCVISEQRKPTFSTRMPLVLVAIRLLIIVCTVQKNQFYIPGETNLHERLRKRSFDSGVYSILQQINLAFKDDERTPFGDIRREIADSVLQHPDVNDLAYYLKVLDELGTIQGSQHTAADSQADSSESHLGKDQNADDSPRHLDEQRVKNPFSSD